MLWDEAYNRSGEMCHVFLNFLGSRGEIMSIMLVTNARHRDARVGMGERRAKMLERDVGKSVQNSCIFFP